MSDDPYTEQWAYAFGLLQDWATAGYEVSIVERNGLYAVTLTHRDRVPLTASFPLLVGAVVKVNDLLGVAGKW